MAATGVTFEIIGNGFYEGNELIFYTQMPPSAKIIDLKGRIAKYYHVPVERQTLHYAETENLQDDRTIESYHFNSDDHVTVLLIVAPMENFDMEAKESEKNLDAKDEKYDIDQVKEGEKNTDDKKDE